MDGPCEDLLHEGLREVDDWTSPVTIPPTLVSIPPRAVGER
jgi:hypothetical protein